MTKEDIIRMAQEAGARAQQNKNCDVEYLFSIEQIQRLFVAAKAEENEACAKVCEDMCKIKRYERNMTLIDAATAIRARSNND